MKKEYSKPYIVMESFQLNAAIATTCTSSGKYPLNHTQDTCIDDGDKAGEPGIGYFGPACPDNVLNPGGEQDDAFCYHNALSDLYFES